MATAQHSTLPDTAKGCYQRGQVFREQGDMANAIMAFNQALQYQPDFVEACFELARILEETAPLGLAIKTYQYLLVISPAHTAGKAHLFALQSLFQKLLVPFDEGAKDCSRGDWDHAVLSFGKVLAIHPRVPDAWSNLALALYHLRRPDEALAAASEALRMQPEHADALSTCGNIYQSTGQYDQALATFRHIVEMNPGDAKAWANIGKVLQRLDDDAGAASAYEAALRIDPRNPEILAEQTDRLRRLCRWEKASEMAATLTSVLTTTNQCASPFLVTLTADAKLQLENAKRYAAAFHPGGKACDTSRPLPADARSDSTLRIGYISADFCQHATAFLISELFEHHDKKRFDIIAYSCGKADGSAEEARIKQSVGTFRDITAMDSQAAANVVRKDGIDILVDLKGYTRGERMDVLALRPAPIQMHYLGYPGTTGAPFIDYFIADTITAPKGSDVFFSEKLIRLPHCYQINDRKRPLPQNALPRKAYGLPEKGFVFCDFNNSYKITPQLFAVWMRLLAAVPGSVLWLYETHAEATANLREAAKKHGIDPARVIPARTAPLTEHFSRYRHVDLFLDTTPICGHTTTSDALWAGVPVITLAGENFVSRVAASLLHATGLPELVTTDAAAYEALALELAKNPERLRQLREHLETGRMGFALFDSVQTTRSLEAAYKQVAHQHRAGFAPSSFAL